MAKKAFEYKEIKDNGDILQIRVWRVEKSEKQPDGVSYSMVYIRNGERLIGHDNFEGHAKGGSNHHRHIEDRVFPYEFVDEWKAIEDFYIEIEKARQRGLI